jgi:hypothetical protein
MAAALGNSINCVDQWCRAGVCFRQNTHKCQGCQAFCKHHSPASSSHSPAAAAAAAPSCPASGFEGPIKSSTLIQAPAGRRGGPMDPGGAAPLLPACPPPSAASAAALGGLGGPTAGGSGGPIAACCCSCLLGGRGGPIPGSCRLVCWCACKLGGGGSGFCLPAKSGKTCAGNVSVEACEQGHA